MLGIAMFFLFMLLGCIAASRLFCDFSRMTRLWLGMVMGLVEMMWLPSVMAFFCDFTQIAHLYAVEAAVLIAYLSVMLIPRRARFASFDGPDEEPPARLVLLLLIPLTILIGYLQYTHTLRPMDGALYVGQSTYGDLCMHLGFSTSLLNAPYPPEYNILPGTRLGYPFLVDALSASMQLFGCDIALSFIIPGTVMTALIGLGLMLFTYRVTKKNGAVVLAFLLFFLNGGLGFLYILDASKLKSALTDFYMAPANMPDLNLRWVNVICDMLIPQRTSMAGWMTVIPALYLLFRGMQTEKRQTFIALGVLAGAMPMIHTHSFLALGLISAGAMAHQLIFAPDAGTRKRRCVHFLLYGGIAVALALPQLMLWTFPQTIGGGSLRFLFNWVNFDETTGWLKDEYFWFWIKNVGLVFLCFLPAALTAKGAVKALAAGALVVYAVAETVQFQPNVYDNNKLFYVAFIAMLPATADFLVRLYKRIRPAFMRRTLAALFILVSTASGAISVARECVSSYQIFSPGQVQAAEYIKENLPEDAVFLTAGQHNNAVAVLTGRKIVCGSAIYVYYHGLDYARRQADVALMLAYPGEYRSLFAELNVQYVYVSSYECAPLSADWQYIDNPLHWQDEYRIDLDYFEENCALLYCGGPWYDEVRIYDVTRRADDLVM